MTDLPYFVVDAFTSTPFAGNPAAVVPLAGWLADAVMQSIAAEMNLSETAFFAAEPGSDGFRLRWFTPRVEVDLCGHATLASAHVLMNRLEPGRRRVVFQSRSGPLTVDRDRDRLVLDFPSRPPQPVDDRALLDQVEAALGARPVALARARDLVAIYDHGDQIRGLRPSFGRIAEVASYGLIATAPADGADRGEPGRDLDFVSRFFVPAQGIDEDPVTGSAHCTLVPYWASRLGRTALRARQVSARGGDLDCELVGDRVRLGGSAVLVASGTLHI